MKITKLYIRTINAPNFALNQLSSKVWTQQLMGIPHCPNTLCYGNTTLHVDNDTSEDWPSQNNAEEGTKRGLVAHSLWFCLNRAAEAFIVVAWMDPLMGVRAAHSDFCQNTDDRADSLRRHCCKRALCCCRLRYKRQRWRFWKALTCRKGRQNGWTAKNSCRFSRAKIPF